MTSYRPEFDLARLRGEEAEQMVRTMRSAMLVGDIEVKRDDEARTYGNVYFEYQCRSKADGLYHPSGLAITKATTWAHCIDGAIVFMPTWVVKLIAKQHGVKRECVHGGNPTRGLVVPLAKLLPAAVAVMNDSATKRAA
jgi:hypothetical protein